MTTNHEHETSQSDIRTDALFRLVSDLNTLTEALEVTAARKAHLGLLRRAAARSLARVGSLHRSRVGGARRQTLLAIMAENLGAIEATFTHLTDTRSIDQASASRGEDLLQRIGQIVRMRQLGAGNIPESKPQADAGDPIAFSDERIGPSPPQDEHGAMARATHAANGHVRPKSPTRAPRAARSTSKPTADPAPPPIVTAPPFPSDVGHDSKMDQDEPAGNSDDPGRPPGDED